MDAIFHEPHGIFAAFIFNAAPIFRAKLPAQKLFIFLLWPFPHIKYGDTLRAVGLISACAEYLVNDLLRHRACGCRNAGHPTLGYLIHRRIAAHVE